MPERLLHVSTQELDDAAGELQALVEALEDGVLDAGQLVRELVLDLWDVVETTLVLRAQAVRASLDGQRSVTANRPPSAAEPATTQAT